MRTKKNNLITILITIIIVLVLFLAYLFIIQPAITGKIIKNQQQGYEYGLVSVMKAVANSNCQPVPLTYYNKTINIIAVDCLQMPTSTSNKSD